MKIAVIYARYSSNNQTEQSIDGQLHVCEQYAKEHDIQIIGQYIDRAMTGTNASREAFLQMIEDSKQKTFNTILVYKLDRFARNKYDSVINKKRLKDNGVTIVSATESISDSPEGRLFETLIEGMDAYYSEELSRKIRRGI